VVLGIAGEVIFEGRTFVVEDRQEEQARQALGSVGDIAKEAISDSSTALSQAKDALSKAAAAEASLGNAESEANRAQAASSSAVTLAEQARTEADSFEADIRSAKKQAAEAEAHLKEATKRANALTAQLDRITTPRSVLNSPQIIASLEPYKDTEYTFSAVCQEEECTNLLKEIDAMLQNAGWKRVKPPSGFPAINIYGNEADFAVTLSLTSGIRISIDSSDPSKTRSLQIKDLPQPVRAAITLNLDIFSNLSPQEIGEHKVGIDKGTSSVVRISVGQKPLP